MNDYLHIGLQIKESDLNDFYKEVLGASVLKEFTLIASDTQLIFGFEKELKAYLVECNGLEIELFVNNDTPFLTCTHLCFTSTNALEIAEKATGKGYPLYVRIKYETDTYFIKDLNNNLFEIKHKL